jgi:hypothetical protein
LTALPKPDKFGLPLKEKAVSESDDVLTPKDMKKWLGREVSNVMKQADLRVQEATDFVTAYALGEITAAEAAERLYQYESKWGVQSGEAPEETKWRNTERQRER